MIYCVEDDNSIRELMIYTLKSAGFEAKGFKDGTAFMQALQEEKPQLIMLDIMLPGEDGISILKTLRSEVPTADIPIIMATAKGTEYDKVIGLDSGADDYLVKPFGMMEMVSHIRAVLRRVLPKKEVRQLKVGNLVISPSEHIVMVNGERVELTLKEYELLLLMTENLGKVFSRESLLEIIWDCSYEGETRTVDVHIGTLRMKLGECGELIKTVRGVGYRMEEK